GKGVGFASALVSPDGRLLAIALKQRVVFWDVATGTELAPLPLANVHGHCFEPSGALLTSDRTGTYRWPIHAIDTAPERWRIGPPQSLTLPPGGGLATSSDGRVIACRSRNAAWESPFAGAWVLHTDQPDRPRQL